MKSTPSSSRGEARSRAGRAGLVNLDFPRPRHVAQLRRRREQVKPTPFAVVCTRIRRRLKERDVACGVFAGDSYERDIGQIIKIWFENSGMT